MNKEWHTLGKKERQRRRDRERHSQVAVYSKPPSRFADCSILCCAYRYRTPMTENNESNGNPPTAFSPRSYQPPFIPSLPLSSFLCPPCPHHRGFSVLAALFILIHPSLAPLAIVPAISLSFISLFSPHSCLPFARQGVRIFPLYLRCRNNRRLNGI